MENKKSKQANLENKKGIFIQVGLVIALALILISFEWTKAPQVMDDLNMVSVIDYTEDIVFTRRDELPKEKIKPKAPPVEIVIEIVRDDEETGAYDIDMEVGPDTEIDITTYYPPEEFIPEPDYFVIVEEMPTFNGGDPKIEFRKYISRNVKYPEIAASNGVSGMVKVQFIVNSSGELVDAVVIRSVDPELDKEALRVIESSPKWGPGKQRGKAVNVIYTFPIGFKLR